MSRFQHHHHHVTPLFYHHVTPILTMYQCHPSTLHVSPPSLFHPYTLECRSSPPIYVDHQLSSMGIYYQGAKIGSVNRRGQGLALDGDLWEIRSNKWKRTLWHSIRMTWNYLYLRIKYTRRAKDRTKHIWLCPCLWLCPTLPTRFNLSLLRM